jgi:hypothetical protein
MHGTGIGNLEMGSLFNRLMEFSEHSAGIGESYLLAFVYSAKKGAPEDEGSHSRAIDFGECEKRSVRLGGWASPAGTKGQRQMAEQALIISKPSPIIPNYDVHRHEQYL